MAERKFRRQYDKSWPHELEPGGGPQLVAVDQHYETVEHLVGRMLEAGERLEAVRAAGFQFGDGKDTGEVDVTRGPGFDLADVSRESLALEARLSAAVTKAAEAKTAAEKAAAEKAVQEAAAALVAQREAAAAVQPGIPAK